MADDLRLRVVTTADSKGLKDAADDVDKLEGKTKDLGESFDNSAESSDHLTKALDGQSEEMSKAQAEARKLNDEIAKSTTRIKDLQTQVVESGNDKAIRKQLSDERSWLSELQRIRKDMSGGAGTVSLPGLDAGGVVGQLGRLRKEVVSDGIETGSAFSKAVTGGFASGLDLIGPLKLALIPGIALLGAELAPALGGVVGGVIAGGIGTVAMAAGLYGAAQDGHVKAAAQELGSTLKDQIFGGTTFVKPAIDALGLLDSTVKRLGISSTLAQTSGSVTTIAQGVSDLVSNAWPGFEKAIGRSGPMANAAAEGMGDLGTAVGYAVDKISDSPGAVEGIEFAFRALSSTIKDVGNIVNWLENRFDNLVHFMTKASAIAEGVALSFGLTGMAGAFDSAKKGWADIGQTADPVLGDISRLTGSTDDYADAAQRAAAATTAISDAWDVLHGKMLNADQSMLAAQQAVDDIADSFKKNGVVIAGNSQAAEENRIKLELAAQAAAAAAQAYFTMTGDAAGANKIMQDQKKAAEDATDAVGKQKDAVHALADELFKLPPSVFITVNFKYGIPAITGLASQIQANLAREDRFDGRASGGNVTAGVPYRINERGSETVTFPSNGTVHPANLSPVGGGGGATLVLQAGGAALFDQFMAEWMRRFVRVEAGGSVQNAFGYGNNN